MLIAVGGLFALQNFTPYGFSSTWPILLILLGVLKLAERVGGEEVPAPPPPPFGHYPPPPYPGAQTNPGPGPGSGAAPPPGGTV
jgi:hypothetical protein